MPEWLQFGLTTVYGVALGFALGWALGERARRLDVQWRERIQRPPGWRPPLLHAPAAQPEGSEPVDEVVRERMIQDAMKEGMTRTEAEADVQEILSASLHDRPF